MRAIYKTVLAPTDHQWVYLPGVAKAVFFANQQETPCLWWDVEDTQGVTQGYPVLMVGTGHPLKDDNALPYVGSALFVNGTLVLHVFA